MRKIALVFVTAVFVPSLLLAWLALRSLRDQERRFRHDLAELNTLFWFVDEAQWKH